MFLGWRIGCIWCEWFFCIKLVCWFCFWVRRLIIVEVLLWGFIERIKFWFVYFMSYCLGICKLIVVKWLGLCIYLGIIFIVKKRCIFCLSVFVILVCVWFFIFLIVWLFLLRIIVFWVLCLMKMVCLICIFFFGCFF